MIIHQWEECLPIISDLLNLEKECFPDSHWEQSTWEKLFSSHQLTLLLAPEHLELAGFLVYSSVAGEGELLKVGVLPKYRRQEIAQKLYDRMIHSLIEDEIEYLFLEVREDNVPAIHFYEKNGFFQTGKRKNYYKSPVCDAILFAKTVDPLSDALAKADLKKP